MIFENFFTNVGSSTAWLGLSRVLGVMLGVFAVMAILGKKAKPGLKNEYKRFLQ